MHQYKIQKELKTKLDNWNSKNTEFQNALFSYQKEKLIKMLEEGYPFDISLYFNEEEKILLGNIYDDLTDQFYSNFYKNFNFIFQQNFKPDLCDLFAEYWIYHQNGVFTGFRKLYFSYTKNYKKALEYAEQLFNNFDSLSSEKSVWLQGILYNENNNFYDKFYEMYNNLREDKKNINIFPLTGRILDDGKYYNIDSWIKFYNENFQRFVYWKLKDNKNNDIDLYSLIIFDLIKYPLEIYENGQNNEKEKVKPILDFLTQDYSDNFFYFKTDKLEYILIAIYYEKIKELQSEINLFLNYQKDIKNRKKDKNKIFKTSLTFSIIKDNEKILKKYIKKTIESNEPEECLKVFTAIELPKKYYEIIERYVLLKNKININNIENTDKLSNKKILNRITKL